MTGGRADGLHLDGLYDAHGTLAVHRVGAMERHVARADLVASEKDAKLAHKLGQLQHFMAAFPQKCMGQLAYFGPT